MRRRLRRLHALPVWTVPQGCAGPACAPSRPRRPAPRGSPPAPPCCQRPTARRARRPALQPLCLAPSWDRSRLMRSARRTWDTACCGRRTATGAPARRATKPTFWGCAPITLVSCESGCPAPCPRRRSRPAAGASLGLGAAGAARLCGCITGDAALPAAAPSRSTQLPTRPLPSGSAPGRPSPSRLSWSWGPTASRCCRSRSASSLACR